MVHRFMRKFLLEKHEIWSTRIQWSTHACPPETKISILGANIATSEGLPLACLSSSRAFVDKLLVLSIYFGTQVSPLAHPDGYMWSPFVLWTTASKCYMYTPATTLIVWTDIITIMMIIIISWMSLNTNWEIELQEKSNVQSCPRFQGVNGIPGNKVIIWTTHHSKINMGSKTTHLSVNDQCKFFNVVDL